MLILSFPYDPADQRVLPNCVGVNGSRHLWRDDLVAAHRRAGRLANTTRAGVARFAGFSPLVLGDGTTGTPGTAARNIR